MFVQFDAGQRQQIFNKALHALCLIAHDGQELAQGIGVVFGGAFKRFNETQQNR